MPKTRLNVSLDQDLAEFAKVFAAENRTSVADMVTQYLLALKRRVEGENMKKFVKVHQPPNMILPSKPSFRGAIPVLV